MSGTCPVGMALIANEEWLQWMEVRSLEIQNIPLQPVPLNLTISELSLT